MSNNKQSSVDMEFVPYEQALTLKELGFNESCLAYWYNETPANPEGQCLVYYKKPWDEQKIINGIIRDYYFAPTFSQAFRWFRDKHKLGAIISQFGWGIENELGQIVHNISDSETPLCYEEAEILCLKKLIKIQGGNK